MRIIRAFFSGWGVLLLLLMLVIINGAYKVIADREQVVSGQPGELLYAAGFDGFTDEWQQSPGQEHRIIEGVMRVQSDTKTIFATSSPVYGDFDASVTFRVTQSAETNDGVGLVFRLQQQSCDMPLPLLCDLDGWNIPALNLLLTPFHSGQRQSGHYAFLVTNDGYYGLAKFDETLQQIGRITVWHNGGDLVNKGLNVDNRIRVVGRGDQFQFFINGRAVDLCIPNPGEKPTGSAESCLGQRVSVWEDASYATGQIGVIVYAEENFGTVAEFDAFTVTMPRDSSETPSAQI